MGKKLDAARKELGLAARSIETLKGAASVDVVDEAWKQFLGQLSRVWNKTEAALKGDPSFYKSQCFVNAKKMRDSDELLRYLTKARDAHDHTVNDVTDVTMPSSHFSVRGSTDGWQHFHINRMTAEQIEYSTNSPANVTVKFVPGAVLAVPAITRGISYPVPTQHAGKQLSDSSLLNLATLGHAFYVAFIEGMAAEGWGAGQHSRTP